MIRRRALLAGATASALAPGSGGAAARARVVVVRARDRAAAVAACLDALAFSACAGREVALKANYNSDDPFPASTHPETLRALAAGLRGRGATGLVLGERSGMGDTRQVLQRTGARTVVEAAGGRVVVLDDVPREGWRHVAAEHWPRGLHAARLFADAPCVVQTMCCKTHRFGGHVTLALKNTIGLVAKRVPGDGHDYMSDLHSSHAQRDMIAEANLAWRPALNVMDALEAFVDGGPEQGTRVAPGVFLASEDRCALDATAIALLRLHGLKGPASRGPIGRTDQLARAVTLGIGAAPASVDVIAPDQASRETAARLGELLAAG